LSLDAGRFHAVPGMCERARELQDLGSMRTESPAVHTPESRAPAPRACRTLLIAVALALPGCVGDIEGIATSDGEPLAGVDAGNPPQEYPDADVPVADPETVCDDSTDNDGDNLTDCDDPDCAAASNCGYPAAVYLNIDLYFDASSLAEMTGQGDCNTKLTITATASALAGCATCDKTYTGPYVYGVDTCPDSERPPEGSYSFTFTSETQREVYVLDAEGLWALVGTATGSNGVFTVTRSDPVDYEGYDAGTMNTTITITDQ